MKNRAKFKKMKLIKNEGLLLRPDKNHYKVIQKTYKKLKYGEKKINASKFINSKSIKID